MFCRSFRIGQDITTEIFLRLALSRLPLIASGFEFEFATRQIF